MRLALCFGLHLVAVRPRDGALRRRAAARPRCVGAFIPFVGAWIALKDQPVDVETEAYVAIAGPVLGTIAALAVHLWARPEDSGLLPALAYCGSFLNLF